MNKKYPMVRNSYLRMYLYLYDLIASTIMFFVKPKKTRPIKRLLLRNPAALGDVLYTLRLVRAIKSANPDIEIGLLVGSGALSMVSSCEDIDFIHIEDHWSINRSPISRWAKIKRWVKTKDRALAEIKKLNYDASVDCYYYFPSGAYLLWRTGIPIRIGYDSHEGVSFYTGFLNWKNEDTHNVEYQKRLVEKIGIQVDNIAEAKVKFIYHEIDALLLDKLQLKDYIVISVGAGVPIKEWDDSAWQKVMKYISNYSIRIVLVGAGKREQMRVDFLMKDAPINVISFCNQLSIMELSQVIQHAKLFIGLDSFAGHLAAMHKVLQVSIMHGGANRYQWLPYGNFRCIVVRKQMICSPCYFPSVCKYENQCMKICVDDVVSAVEQQLKLVGKD